jgi:protein SCO1/2
MKPVPRITVWFAVLALALVVGVAAALYLTDKTVRDAAKTATAPSVGGPFSLIDHKGRTVTDLDYRGKLMLVYFGYTFCPDVCPTGLYKIGQALDALGRDGDKIYPLFITVDSERDTVEVLVDYVSAFHPRLVGLTGSQEQVNAAAKAYRVYHTKAYPEGGEQGANDYLIDHTTLTYLMGPDGGLLEMLSHRTSVDELVGKIRKHLD